MTDREKLIELLGEDTCHRDGCYDCDYGGDRDACIEYLKNSMADHLLANGVTFQKWIPVTERLPEEKGFVLVFTVDKTVGEALMEGDGQFYWANTDEDAESLSVTHWMPLPQPPKED